ncbi:MAG: DUF1698 domain-containing protein [Candidatus Omnitrophica bacterium]|nr:DUF1698 domain-containing protein [Candidatus Omnitrophota bacterium]
MLSKEEIVKGIQDLSPWWQTMHVIDDIDTPGVCNMKFRWYWLRNFLPTDLEGMSVLDVGCNAGFCSFKAAELRAPRVLGIDFEPYIRQARFLQQVKGLKNITFEVSSLYKMKASEKFNITLCLGFLYHAKYPFLALKKISDLTTDMILLETEALVEECDTCKMRFIEHTYLGDSTVWWLIGQECLRGMLREVGFKFVKSYFYPDNHPIFGLHSSQGLTQEGLEKSRRIVMIAFKHKNFKFPGFGGFISEVSELDEEIDLNNLGEI